MRIALRLMIIASLAAGFTNGTPGLAEDPIDFFHPLILRPPAIEQQIEIHARRDATTSGHDVTASVVVDYRLVPRWQIELLLPLLVRESRNALSKAGIGDVTIENKFLIFASRRLPTAVAAGVDVTSPSGSPARDLGGNTAITLFGSAGVSFGRLELLADFGCRWTVRGPATREQRVDTVLAGGLRVLPWLVLFGELTTGTVLRRQAFRPEPLLDGPIVVLGPGVHVDIAPGRRLLFGVEKPITSAHAFNNQVLIGFVWDF